MEKTTCRQVYEYRIGNLDLFIFDLSFLCSSFWVWPVRKPLLTAEHAFDSGNNTCIICLPGALLTRALSIQLSRSVQMRGMRAAEPLGTCLRSF